MTDNRRHIATPEDVEVFARLVGSLPRPFTVAWHTGGKRSLSANALVHKWYGEIAKARGDMTASEVKAECHITYGLPIRLRDEAFAWLWDRTGAKLPREKQLALFQREVLAMTSAMTTAELKEYMDEMLHDATARGIRLTLPEERDG